MTASFVLHVLLGLVFGSFGSVLVSRLPRGEWPGGRSQCPACGMVLAVCDLVPIVSYLALHGRCRACKASISAGYPALEVASAALFGFVATFWALPLLPSLLLALSLWLLLLIAVIDAKHQGIPDVLTFALIVCALAVRLLGAPGWEPPQLFAPLIPSAFFGAQWLLSRGRWVGSGDILLGAGIGVLAGTWWLALAALGIAYILGALVASWLLLTHRSARTDHLAFGPFLALGIVFALVFEESIRGALLF